MFFLRLILIFFLFLLVRRLIRGFMRRPVPDQKSGRPAEKEYSDLTEQDVSDAEFEELP